MEHDLRPLHQSALRTASQYVERVTNSDLDRQTPCAAWTLADLLAHMIGQHRGFASAITAPSPARASPMPARCPALRGSGPSPPSAAIHIEPDRALSCRTHGRSQTTRTTTPKEENQHEDSIRRERRRDHHLSRAQPAA